MISSGDTSATLTVLQHRLNFSSHDITNLLNTMYRAAPAEVKYTFETSKFSTSYEGKKMAVSLYMLLFLYSDECPKLQIYDQRLQIPSPKDIICRVFNAYGISAEGSSGSEELYNAAFTRFRADFNKGEKLMPRKYYAQLCPIQLPEEFDSQVKRATYGFILSKPGLTF